MAKAFLQPKKYTLWKRKCWGHIAIRSFSRIAFWNDKSVMLIIAINFFLKNNLVYYPTIVRHASLILGLERKYDSTYNCDNKNEWASGPPSTHIVFTFAAFIYLDIEQQRLNGTKERLTRHGADKKQQGLFHRNGIYTLKEGKRRQKEAIKVKRLWRTYIYIHRDARRKLPSLKIIILLL